MAQITFLGTTCMQPTKERNHSAIALQYKNELILFDCGEGTQRQMRLANLKPSKVTRICISHWHGDHILGLPGLLSTMGTDQYSKKVHIYGPKGSKRYMTYMLKAFFASGVIDYELHEVNQGVIASTDSFVLKAAPLKHSTPCVGYAFEEKPRLRIHVAKAKAAGLTGPILGKLQTGEKVNHKGKVLDPAEFTYRVKGKKCAYVADTRPCDGAAELAQDANLLICESTFHSEEHKKAKEHHHMTAAEGGKLARAANVKQLVLTHPSLRYKTTERLVDDAKQHFDNVSFAEDFMKFNF